MSNILWRRAVETNIVELTGYINNKHHLLVDGKVPLDPGEVKIIILSRDKKEEDDTSTEDLLKIAKSSGAFNFLNNPEEDIYSLDDGTPINE